MAEIEAWIKTVRFGRIATSSDRDGIGADAEHNMGMGFGILGDLFWLTLPEMRPILKWMVIDELDSAIEQNRPTFEISPYELCSKFRREVFEPALENASKWAELAEPSCATLRQIVKIYPSLNQLLRNALGVRIFEGAVLEPTRSRLAKIDSELLSSIVAIENRI